MDTLINFHRLAPFKLILITYLTQHAILALDLLDYQTASYTNTRPESTFNHFVSYNRSVYIGATDALYQLGEDFLSQQIVRTSLGCESGGTECPNYNKILLIDEVNNRLATCWSVKGFCDARNLADISDVLYERNSRVVPPRTLTTEAIIAPGPESSNTLYVAATYDRTSHQEAVYPVTRRSLTFSDSGEANIRIALSVSTLIDFIINYISSFTIGEMTYFVQSQVQDFGGQEAKRIYVSKISRVCHSDDDLESYAEILLRCQDQDSSDDYNLVQAAYVGPAGRDLAMSLGLNETDNVFYGVFAKSASQEGNEPSNQSALCIFKLSDIEDSFISAIAGCLNEGDDYRLRYLGGKCPNFDLEDPRMSAKGLQCRQDVWEYAEGIGPSSSTLVEWSDITPSSIITTTHRNHTIAFVGTAHGEMIKVHIHNDTFAREYERYPVGSPVLRDAEIVENQEEVTILTKQQLLRLQVEKCSAYTTCDKCIGDKGDRDGDPYCGWCVLERRCSRYSDCPMADVSTRWLPYNSAQCVDISIISPNDNFPITETEQQITLTVEQLPDPVDDHTYQCVFDENSPITNTVSGNQLTCQTPPGSMIPSIKSGNDHVAMQLYVYSTETKVNFVQRNVYFYECNTHKGCVACTNSSWACDWCIYSDKCTHDNMVTCSTEDDVNSTINGQNIPGMKSRPGPDECPQLLAQDGETLVPVGVSRDIRVRANVTNLPDDVRVSSYTCILDIEGTNVETMAERSGDEFTCNSRMYMYGEDIQDLDVSLTIVWNGDRRLDDIYGFKVTLYKCEVDRPDCSRCLSNSTARPELMCGWCNAGAMCTVSDRSQCSGDWISPSNDGNCPAPVLSGVWPPSGPHEGNTIISVTGTDLGRQFTDIRLVTVGGQDCSIDGLSQEYVTGSSVSCRTLSGNIDSEEVIAVTVQGTDGTPQQSTGSVIFTYRDPSISSFEPVEGPAAGGTMVTIGGQYLDACSHISATIGSSECRMSRNDDVINATTAKCHTTYAPVGTSEPLQVYFDGAMRRSTDVFTYRLNPAVTGVQPLKTIQSGGISLTVTGSGFNLAQDAQLIMYTQDGAFQEDCAVQNDTIMVCRTPDTSPTSDDMVRRKRQAEPLEEARFGFTIADVTNLLTWSDDNNVTLANFRDPEYQVEVDPIQFSNVINIKGSNLNVGSTKDDVTVYIGEDQAVVNSLGETALTISLPDNNPGKQCINGNRTDDPCVVVVHGNLEFYIGTVSYPLVGINVTNIIIAIAVVCVLLIVTLCIVLLVYRRKVGGHIKDRDQLLFEMETIKNDIGEQIREAFVKLQTDVTDLTSDLRGSGMPFVQHRQYALSMFFTGLNTRPLTNEPEDTDDATESAMLELSKLLSNKPFLMALIQTIDEDKSVPNKDRLTIASMLTVLMILEDKLPYLTDVMMTIMTAQVQEAIEDDKPTRLFQRTELIMEKLMSNWIALSLYDFLKDNAGYPLFLLYRAIKCQTEKGPVDMVTNKSYISLNDDNIISEILNYEEITLDVIINDEDGEEKEVTVLDIDTIGQAKGKILDAIHRNRPYSNRKQPWEVDLEWRQGRSGHLILQDVDVSSENEPGWKRINTMKHFSVPSGAKVALTSKQEMPNATVSGKSLSRYSNISGNEAVPGITFSAEDTTQAEDGIMLWHLGKEETDEPTDPKAKSKRRRKTLRQRKQIREISFPRLLGTKGALQEYMDSMFAAILNKDDVPIGIKYIFDIFDGLAVRHNIGDDAVVHKWKSNILPLRFWQKIITHPQYIFDINQTPTEEASLAVISQAFYDAFRKNPEQISKAASYTKLLYNKEIPKYRDMVEEYYSSVKQMPRVKKSALDQDLKEICEKFAGLFSRISTLMELHKLIHKYKDKLVEALEDDEAFEQSGLSEKLQKVLALLPNDKAPQNDYVYQQDVASEEEDRPASYIQLYE